MMKKMQTEEFPFGECHMHIFMNGADYREAVRAQKNGVNEEVIRRNFAAYAARNICWVREGGDKYGVSRRAMDIAPAYGITYRTPIYAIHRKGHYGAIVGRAYESMGDYLELVRGVRAQGGHFIKIMISGIVDFAGGGLSEESLPDEEIGELVHIAHEEGFAVMAHANGSRAVCAAARAGADSVEHGNFCDAEALLAMAEAGTVWVPTAATVRNLLGDGRYPESVTCPIWERTAQNLRYAAAHGVRLAAGSDAGAYRVPHGQGLIDELAALGEALSADCPDWRERVMEGERILRGKF